MEIDRLYRAAKAYTELGWPVFTVTGEKEPFANCTRCREEMHDPQDCVCLRCHAFYAATLDLDKVHRMLVAAGGQCCLAIRTGSASGIIAVDAENTDKFEHGATGVEVLDDFEAYTAGVSLPGTLRARSASGGVHLLYALPAGALVTSRNRVLPNVDIKSEGGYIVAPPAEGRRWVNWGHTLVTPGDDLMSWLVKVSGTTRKRHSSKTRIKDGVVPAGSRYDYTRDLVYRLRKNGVSRDQAEEVCRIAWEKYQQPPDGMRVCDGVWYLPWKQVVYELDRAEIRVPPEEDPLTFTQRAWLNRST